MANPYLATYLNDHLAGSAAAIELLDHLEKEHAGTQIAMLAVGLREDIAADRRELEALMARLGISQSTPRKATAWLAEKATQLKLKLDDPQGGGLRLLETFEALSLGIEGKRLLWRSLKTAAVYNSELQGTDYQGPGTQGRRATPGRRAVPDGRGQGHFRTGKVTPTSICPLIPGPPDRSQGMAIASVSEARQGLMFT